jgi:hypothetical protein
MNLYINIIPIISEIQKTTDLIKPCNLEYNTFLCKIFNLLKSADLLNNSIFLDKNWDLLDYFDAFGFTLPLQLLYNKNNVDNIDNSKPNNSKPNNSKSKANSCIIPKFNLNHHTQYNFMRQEQSIIKKKINLDYIKTQNIDLVNIYYNIKRFMNNNNDNINISNSRSKKKKSISSTEENKYHIDKLYIKIIDKIDELLS